MFRVNVQEKTLLGGPRHIVTLCDTQADASARAEAYRSRYPGADVFIEEILGADHTATGLVALDEPQDLEALPSHEDAVGAPVDGAVAPDWEKLCPVFRFQGATYECTGFVGASIGSILEAKETGKRILFSAGELFFRAGGTVVGNYLLKTAQAMKVGLVLETDVPTYIPDHWGTAGWLDAKARSRASAHALETAKQYAISNPASVIPTTPYMRLALHSSPLSIAIGIGAGYFEPLAEQPGSYTALHNVVLLGIDGLGNMKIFDSLTYKQGFSGIHWLKAGYEVFTALSFIDLPDGWQKPATFANALNHYGIARNLGAEQSAAKALQDASNANRAIRTEFGRLWTVLCNAVAYGGYSVQDCLNQMFSIHRGTELPFDLDQPRPAPIS
jgi:hypothetical protein